ncbi:MAG TPA: regulatory protein RecX [candidate division Zixibacteria bacterium]|nr:regulatory protein RecX [candidate division Zixibacteria bacterium]
MSADIKLTKLSRAGSRVTITFSNGDDPIVVSEEIVYRHRLVEGITLTISQVEQLKLESDLFQCDRVAARLLAGRGYSTGELKRKLRLKQFNPPVIEQTLKKYRRQGVLDDSRYAFEVARQVVESRPCGRAFLTAYLQRKMIDRQLAESAVEMVLGTRDEEEDAVKALGKRWREFSQFELEVARKKAYTYLARRGFGYDAARKAFDRLTNQ